MGTPEVSFFAGVLVALTAVMVLLARAWRWTVAWLAIQYLGMFLLVGAHWPLPMAMTKLVAGWMAIASLGIAEANASAGAASDRQMPVPGDTGEIHSGSSGDQGAGIASHRSPMGPYFLVFAVVLIGLVLYQRLGQLQSMVPGANRELIWGGLVLCSLGLLKVSLTSSYEGPSGSARTPFHVFVGLLTVLSGFEILYTSMQSSLLMAGLLAAVTLGLALVGAYLISLPTIEEPA